MLLLTHSGCQSDGVPTTMIGCSTLDGVVDSVVAAAVQGTRRMADDSDPMDCSDGWAMTTVFLRLTLVFASLHHDDMKDTDHR